MLRRSGATCESGSAGPEAGDAGGGESTDGAGGDRVHADVLVVLTEVEREIADAGLEGGLGDAHDVVPRDGAEGAEVGHREDGGVVAHDGERRASDGREGEDADVHRYMEAFTRGLVEGAAEIFPVGEGYGVDEDVDRAEVLPDFRHDVGDRFVAGDVALFDEVAADGRRQGLHAALEDLAGVAEPDLRTLTVKGLRYAQAIEWSLATPKMRAVLPSRMPI